jgi:hypothetical protein
LNTITGVGHLHTDRKDVRTQVRTPRFLPPITATIIDKTNILHTNMYVYSQLNYLQNVTATLGMSADFFEGVFVDHQQVNPKLGVTWTPFPRTTLRAAAFRALKRSVISDQTIEPTQVAGFNQFFDDVDGTDSWRYGIGVDQKFSANVYAGTEFSKRDLEGVPFLQITSAGEAVREVDWKEYFGRAYLYWTPHAWLAVSTEYQFERFERAKEFGLGIREVDTHRVPLGVSFFHPSRGVTDFGSLTPLFVTSSRNVGVSSQLA